MDRVRMNRVRMNRMRAGSRPAGRHDFIGRAPYANDVALSGLLVDWFFQRIVRFRAKFCLPWRNNGLGCRKKYSKNE
jgi:hypothetical protein